MSLEKLVDILFDPLIQINDLTIWLLSCCSSRDSWHAKLPSSIGLSHDPRLKLRTIAIIVLNKR
jgi:hypothetical protein